MLLDELMLLASSDGENVLEIFLEKLNLFLREDDEHMPEFIMAMNEQNAPGKGAKRKLAAGTSVAKRVAVTATQDVAGEFTDFSEGSIATYMKEADAALEPVQNLSMSGVKR